MSVEELDPQDCLEWAEGEDNSCSGPVEYRMPLSGTGRAFPRCEHHWDLRLQERERELERDERARHVDPSYAGERYWDDY